MGEDHGSQGVHRQRARFLSTTTAGSDHLDWFGTVRGRIGYTGIDNLLMYATGGLAYGAEKATLGVSSVAGFGAGPVPFNVVASNSSIRTEWTVGAGAEVRLISFGPSWSVKGEYLYYDLGSDRLAVTHTAARGGLNGPPD